MSLPSPFPRRSLVALGAGLVALSSLAVVSPACREQPPVTPVVASPCQVVPPTTLSETQRADVRAKVDAAYAGLKGGGAAVQDAKSNIDATFVAISDNGATCAMILRIVACAMEHHDEPVALGFKDIVKDVCTIEAPPPPNPPCPAWVDAAGGQLPTNPVKGGREPAGWDLYVCRAKTSAGVTVAGKLISGWGCYVADGNTERVAQEYEVLTATGCALSWAAAPAGVPPANAVEASSVSSMAIRSCRAAHAGGTHLGFTGWGTNHECVFSYGGGTYRSSSFEVLVKD